MENGHEVHGYFHAYFHDSTSCFPGDIIFFVFCVGEKPGQPLLRILESLKSMEVKDLAAAWRQKGWDRRRKQRWAGQSAKELQGKDGKSIVKCEDLHECFVFLSSEVFHFWR